MAEVPSISVLDSGAVPRDIATTTALITLMGALNSAKETNPDAASATQLSLIRGILDALSAVDIATLPALVTGTANIGRVGAEFASGTISNVDVDSLETVAEIATGPYKTLMVTFTVTTAVLSDFNIDVRAHGSGDYVTLFGTANEFLYPDGFLLWCSGDLNVAATSGVHGFILDCSCFETVRIQAAGTSSVVAGHYGAK